MRSWMIALSAGIAWSATQSALLAPWQVLAAAVLSLLCFLPALPGMIRKRGLRARLSRSLTVLAGLYLLGLCYGNVHGLQLMAQQLPAELEGRELTLAGQVTGLPLSQQRFGTMVLRFNMLVAGSPDDSLVADYAAYWPGKKLRLSWYQPDLSLRPGDCVTVRVRLRAARGLANPVGFDYRLWLLSRDIVATGTVRALQTRFAETGACPVRWVESWRYQLRQQLLRGLKGQPGRGIFLALLLGDKSALSASQRQLFQASGTSHLMVISGLHIGLLSGVVFYLARFVLAAVPSLLLHVPLAHAAYVPALGVALLYTALAGFSLPTLRALIMFAVFVCARWLRLPQALAGSLLLALCLILLADPLAAVQPGSLLSFGAVTVLMFGLGGRLGYPPGSCDRQLWQWFRPQYVCCVGMLPLTLWLFGFSAWQVLPANILAVPFIGLLIVPVAFIALLCLLVSPGCGEWLFRLLGVALEQALVLLDWLMALHPPRYFWMGEQGVALLLVMTVLLLLLPRGMPLRYLGLGCLVCLILTQPGQTHRASALPSGSLRVHVLDVGQGLAVLLETAHGAVLYDTGMAFGEDSDMAQAVIIPYLRQQLGISRLDQLIVSHSDLDHRGGLGSLLNDMPVTEIRAGEPWRLPDTLQKKVRRCQAGQTWQLDGLDFRVLHPDSYRYRKANNNSCVLRVSSGRYALLLSGDIESLVENHLLAQQAADLRAGLLLVPHHGSNSSSQAEFIAAVAPEFAVYSTAYLNRFGHPAEPVVARYAAAGIRTLNTADDGALVFELNAASGWQLRSAFRHDEAAWWQR